MDKTLILYPVLVLVAWIAVVYHMMAVMVYRDLKHIRIREEEGRHLSDLMPKWSEMHRRMRENYNHLHEQPTTFFALILVIFGLGHVDTTQLTLAWAFVSLRILHTFIQVFARVRYRMLIFAISWLVLVIMILREFYSLSL